MIYKLYWNGNFMGSNKNMIRLEKLAEKLNSNFGISDFGITSVPVK